jgi:hypothetical protein
MAIIVAITAITAITATIALIARNTDYSYGVILCVETGGETIREMQNSTGCKINVAPQTGPHELEREIGLIGSRESIDRAKQAIEDKVEVVVNIRARKKTPSLWPLRQIRPPLLLDKKINFPFLF